MSISDSLSGNVIDAVASITAAGVNLEPQNDHGLRSVFSALLFDIRLLQNDLARDGSRHRYSLDAARDLLVAILDHPSHLGKTTVPVDPLRPVAHDPPPRAAVRAQYAAIKALHLADPEAIAVRIYTEFRNQTSDEQLAAWGVDPERYIRYDTEPKAVAERLAQLAAIAKEGAPIRIIAID